jgi:preprotein translocase subunit SecA
MFSLLKKLFSSPPIIPEKVWAMKAYKYQGLYQDTLQAHKNGEKVLIFTQFEKTLEEACFVLEQKKVNFYRFSKGDEVAILNFHQLAVFQVNALQKNTIKDLQSLLHQAPVQLFIIEHHPLRANDEELIAILREIAPQSEPIFYTSLEDAVLAQFATDNLKQLLEKLGMKPDESFQHKLISNAIIEAQKKLASQARGNRITYSAEEWLKANL